MEESNWPGRVGSIACLQHSLYPSPQTDYGGGAPLLRTPTVSGKEHGKTWWELEHAFLRILSTFARCMTWRCVATVLFQMRTLWCRAPSTAYQGAGCSREEKKRGKSRWWPPIERTRVAAALVLRRRSRRRCRPQTRRRGTPSRRRV
jgi:hypothetical protein